MKKISVFIQALVIALFGNIYNANAQLVVSTTVTQNVSCYGGSNGVAGASVSSGTTPYTYTWLPGSETTQTATGLSAATYTVHVKDVHGLTGTATATIGQPTAPLSITASAKYAAVCPGTADSLYASGSGGTTPYSYAWTGPYGDVSCYNCQNTSIYHDGMAYVVTAINDMNGCTASASVSVTVRPFPYVTIEGPLSPIAPGRSDTLIANATGATSYTWSNSATTSNIIVSPSVPTTYSVLVHNTYGCADSSRYSIDTNSLNNGNSSTSPIPVKPSTTLTAYSYSTYDSVVWFSFVPTDSNNQIIANSAFLGMPVPHVHRLTLYNSSLKMLVDEPMPDITGANQIRIDISHLHTGSTYYVRAARCPAHANMAGCNPSATGECNPSQRWDFQMAFRTVPVFVPQDSGGEAPSVSQLYYENRGQIQDLNKIPRFDIKTYSNNTNPNIFCSDSGISFVYQHAVNKDSVRLFRDTIQRVDMVLTGSSVQPSQPMFKMEEDSGAGYLNYFLGFVPNGVPKVEGYSRLVYKNVYANIDMHVYSNSVGTKLYFVCNPGGTGGGGNPANIELQFKGANSVSVASDSGINVVTSLGTLSFAPGYAYMDSAGVIKPKAWHANFEVVNSTTVRFHTGSFNTNEPLIIRVDRGRDVSSSFTPNANLNWSTYFGGTDEQDIFNDVCSDKHGNVYAAGCTQSLAYPVTPGIIQDTISNNNPTQLDAAVAKFDTLDRRTWATYFGGSDNEWAYGIQTDAAGDIYITGNTFSFDLPGASAPSSPLNYIQPGIANFNFGNAFIAMFDNSGTKTYWTTYYGGTFGGEVGHHIAIDADTNIYIVGSGVEGSVINHFPIFKSIKPGAYNDSTYGTGFILEFNASHAFNSHIGINRTWATRIGDTNHLPQGNLGQSLAGIYGCTVDASNNFYITGTASYGYTNSVIPIYPCKAVFPIGNAVITKFNSNNNIAWSTYYGGNVYEIGYAITVAPAGNIYITGNSVSDSVVSGIGIETKKLGSGFFQRYNGNAVGDGNGFIAEFSSSGTLEWGTYFGGSGLLYGTAIGLDVFNNLYITGRLLTDMPLPMSNVAGTYSQLSYVNGNGNHVGDAFVAAFSNPDTSPDYEWGTFFGSDEGTGMTLTHSNGNYWMYIVGNLGGGYTPLVFPAGSYKQTNYFFFHDTLVTGGTSFISQFNLSPIISSAGINNITNKADGVLVYPNPTSHTINVQFELDKSQNIELTLYSSMGEMVFDKKLSLEAGTINQEIDVSSLPNGIYLLRVNEGTKFLTQKITKED